MYMSTLALKAQGSQSKSAHMKRSNNTVIPCADAKCKGKHVRNVKRTKKQQQVHELVLTQALLVAGSLYKQRQYTKFVSQTHAQERFCGGASSYVMKQM